MLDFTNLRSIARAIPFIDSTQIIKEKILHISSFSHYCNSKTIISEFEKSVLKSCIKSIHLVTDDGLYDRKVFYEVKNLSLFSVLFLFIYLKKIHLVFMNDLSIINILLKPVADIYITLKDVT